VAAAEGMVCNCCGLWQVKQITMLLSTRRRPVTRLRITWGRYYIADAKTVAEAAALLGVPLSRLRDGT
jgi:hypothetical protein